MMYTVYYMINIIHIDGNITFIILYLKSIFSLLIFYETNQLLIKLKSFEVKLDLPINFLKILILKTVVMKTATILNREEW